MLYAQDDEEPTRCSTPTREEFFQHRPAARLEAENLEKMTRAFIQARATNKTTGTQAASYVVPIVFHVFGTDFAGKTVDDALVKDALKKSNEDFHGLNNDFNDVSDLFKPLRATMDIEFRLAEVDPFGNPTTGINYYNVRTGFGRDYDKDDEIREFAWDNYKYMNVYILLDLKNDILNRSGVAWYPNTTDSDNNVARVVFNGRYLGTNSDENFRRILTHEFGHYLNLIHTFEGGCSGTGDQVDDTPATANNSAGNCVLTAETCPGAGIPNSENFMDYSECYRMFTNGQVARMEAAMQHAARFPLWQTSNHAEVFLQSPSQPKLFYDFTTFSEGFENNGTIETGRDVAIRLVDGPTFSSVGTLPNSTFTVENLPAGLSLSVITTSTTTAVVRITGSATAHAKTNSLRNLKLTFHDAAFSNYAAADVMGYSKPDLRIEYKGPYTSKYVTHDRLVQVGIDGDNFEGIGIIPEQSRPRYELSIDNEQLMIGFDAGVKNVAVTANGEVAFITEGTTIDASLNWDHDDRDRVLFNSSYQTWKGQRGFIGLRIEREGLAGLYYYGWARVEVSADGKLLRFIDLYTHEDPNAIVKAGQADSPLIALSTPTFFEDQSNDGKVSGTIDLILEGGAAFVSQSLVNGTHFTISNLPEGLTASIQKTNNQLAKLVLTGAATQHLRGDGALVKLNFLNEAFSVGPGNRQSFDIQVRFFDPYQITYINTASLPAITAQNTNQWVFLDTDFDFGDNSRYSLTYYDNASQVVFNARGKGFTMDATTLYPISLQAGTQVNASSSFVSTAWGINNAPIFAGPSVPWNGTTGYTGLRFRDRAGRMHYGWIKIEANAAGTSARLLEAAYNTEPDAGITVGQTTNTACYAGSIFNEKTAGHSTSIGTFQFEHFSQKSDFPQNYTDFTDREIKVVPGLSTFSVKAGGSLTSSTNILGMWIDLNNDNDFEDTGEQLYMSAPFNDGTDISGEVTLPNVTGTYTLRITVKNETDADQPQPSPCDFFLHGEVEDYTINISPSNPVHPVADFEMPANISAREVVTITDKSLKDPETWAWTFQGGSPATFTGKTPPEIFYENAGTFEVSLTVTKGGISNTKVKTITVAPFPDAYCEGKRRHTYPNRGDITKVVLGDINNSSATGSATGYADFTHLSTTLEQGLSYPFEITTSKHITSTDGRGTNLIIWIDWNRNNEFSLNEMVFERRSVDSDPDIMTITGNLTVPTIHLAGQTVMRVIRYYSFDQDDRPVCGEISEADIEDYSINLIGNSTPAPVANFEASALTVTAGSTITFTDLSTGNPTAWSWTFEGGTPTTSSAQNPSITFNTAGVYEVSLTASNVGGSHTETKPNYITVTEATPDIYCESSGNRVQYEWIAGVQVGSFSNNSDAQTYSDFTNQTIELARGTSHNITLTPGFSGSAYDEYFRIWIDYNQDGDFEDVGELAFDAGTASNAAVNGSITPPASALVGNTRMRVSMKYNTAPNSCGNVGDGEVEDYTVNITGTSNPITYCESSGNRVQYEWIAGVQIGSFSNTSGAQTYSDYTAQTISLAKDITQTITLTPGFSGSAYDEYFRVWIDYNQDGDFEDAGELVFDAGTASNTAVNGSITVPSSALVGNTRMRVSMKYNTAPNPCGNVGDGEVEDYTVAISGTSQARIPTTSTTKSQLITLYPNPATDQLTIRFSKPSLINQGNTQLVVYDIAGKIVKELTEENIDTEVKLTVGELKSGVYIITIQHGNTLERKVFVKK